MSYDTDDRFNAWMKDIINSAWTVIDTYEHYLLDTTNVDELSKKMRMLYDILPIDPDRSTDGKDKDKKDPM
jgi:hypothetical protein|tara:strand:- start:426 stop:638 length:213 start_codon:yes stop_codon:yes gene_type:complete